MTSEYCEPSSGDTSANFRAACLYFLLSMKARPAATRSCATKVASLPSARDDPVLLDEAAMSASRSGRLSRLQEPVGAELELVEEHARVIDTVGRLPDKYRVVMTLRYVEKMSYKEIAQHLGEPTGTIANRLHRAMKMVQDKLGTPESAS